MKGCSGAGHAYSLSKRGEQLARCGVADEMASVAECSPDASFVSGSGIKVDGGVMAVR
jgi:hypothetical protein